MTMGNVFLFEFGLHIDVTGRKKREKKSGKRTKACMENVSKGQILDLVHFFFWIKVHPLEKRL